jgi:tRNA threonylcarbamoyladenosine biosynthesis protein TsaB
MILVIDTASEQALIGIWEQKWLEKEQFLGGHNLNKIIIQKLKKVMDPHLNNTDRTVIKGIVVNAGPGSFTGLRIGLSVANTIAYTYDIPIVGIKDGLDVDKLLQKGKSVLESRGTSFGEPIVPHYGAEPSITQPKPKKW